MTKKILVAVAGLFTLVGGAVGFGLMMKPAQRPALQVQIERTPERVERGRYLANNVFPCMHCHSTLEPTQLGGYSVPGTEGAGGTCVGREMGLPGKVCSRNITPDRDTGIGAWTDGEILRAIREGVDKNGKGLFPLMPYDLFREMPDEDAYALVAYLRTLAPVKNEVPAKQLDFPVNILSKLAPQPLAGPVAAIDRGDRAAYGHYLTRACYSCHTPVDGRNQPLEGKAFSGGRQFVTKDYTVRSANLTFDGTGIGAWSRDVFISRFAGWRGLTPPKVDPKYNSAMPWNAFSGMTDDDLGAVYDYLKAQPHVANQVQRWPAMAPIATALGQ